MRLYILVLIGFGICDPHYVIANDTKALAHSASSPKNISKNGSRLRTKPSKFVHYSHADNTTINQFLDSQIGRINESLELARILQGQYEQMLENTTKKPIENLCQLNLAVDVLINIHVERSRLILCLNHTFDSMYVSLAKCQSIRNNFKHNMERNLDILLDCPDPYLATACMREYKVQTNMQLDFAADFLNEAGKEIDKKLNDLGHLFQNCVGKAKMQTTKMQLKQVHKACTKK